MFRRSAGSVQGGTTWTELSTGRSWAAEKRRHLRLPSRLLQSTGILPGGHNWVRTSDPSLVRCVRAVAGRPLQSPDVASTCDIRGWLLPDDSSRLRSLALSLALYLALGSATGCHCCLGHQPQRRAVAASLWGRTSATRTQYRRSGPLTGVQPSSISCMSCLTVLSVASGRVLPAIQYEHAAPTF
jgi:hypothetical protein